MRGIIVALTIYPLFGCSGARQDEQPPPKVGPRLLEAKTHMSPAEAAQNPVLVTVTTTGELNVVAPVVAFCGSHAEARPTKDHIKTGAPKPYVWRTTEQKGRFACEWRGDMDGSPPNEVRTLGARPWRLFAVDYNHDGKWETVIMTSVEASIYGKRATYDNLVLRRKRHSIWPGFTEVQFEHGTSGRVRLLDTDQDGSIDTRKLFRLERGESVNPLGAKHRDAKLVLIERDTNDDGRFDSEEIVP